MARDVKTVQVVSDSAGVNLAFTAFVQANGGQYDNTQQTAKMVWANSGTAKVITISTDKTTTDQLVTQASKTFTLPGSAVAYEMPALQNQFWAQSGTGDTNIYVDIDDDTGVTWAVSRPA